MEGKAVLFDDNLVVSFAYDADKINKMKVMGGYWLPVLRAWYLPLNQKTIQELEKMEIEISPDIYQALQTSDSTLDITALEAPEKSSENLNIIIKSRLHLPLMALPREIFNIIKQDLIIPNPVYQQAVRLHRNASGIPENIVLIEYNKEQKMLSLPRGYINLLIWILKKYGIKYHLIDRRVKLPEVQFESKIKLRDYQKDPVKILTSRSQGILQAPAGSGKTVMGLEVVARIRQPALWLTHTRDLANQTLERAVSCLGMSKEEIGMIGQGQVKIGDRLTICIIQKAVQMDFSEIASRFGLVILDEVHHSPASTWGKIINQIPAYYRYGVTATPERADKLDKMTERLIGPVICRIPRHEVEKSGGIIIPCLKVIETHYQSKIWLKYLKRKEWCEENGKIVPIVPFNKLLSEILNSYERNKLIVKILAKECPGHYSLVLSDQIFHLEILQKLLSTDCPDLRIAIIHGKLPKTKRRKILNQISEGSLDVLMAVDIAKEGLDVPRLDRLFLVAGGRNPAQTEQKVGRIQRAFPGKKDSIIFDFVDEQIGVMLAQFYSRMGVYNRLRVENLRRES